MTVMFIFEMGSKNVTPT